MITVISCGEKHDENTVIIIGGHDVTRDEYTYFYENTKLDHNSDVDSNLLDTLKRYCAVYTLAKQCGVKLTEEMNAAIDEEIQVTIDSFGGEEGYNAALLETFMTADVYRKILENEELEIAVREYLTNEFTSNIKADDAAVEADFNANFVRATHILIVRNNGLTDEENRKLAEDLHARILNGEDFETLQKEYGQDIGIDYKNGYYITRGMFNEAFEDTAYALKDNEMSGVVESSVGFHIIKRLPLEIEYLYSRFEDVRYIYKNRVINERLDDIAGKLSVEYIEATEET
jgi:Parvulin-like peptidyl-prolyl isomerase